jgi:hypothetical protein
MSARTGYSGKPLFQKLGLKPEDRGCLINPPEDYFELLELDRSKLALETTLSKGVRFVHGFYDDRRAFEASFKAVAKSLAPDGAYWVSWRKGKVSDMTEDVVRNTALAAGLVDVKVCSVSETWSGLKLVVRKENRK